MDMGKEINFENPMGMSVDMRKNFENRYEYMYSSTCPTLIPTHSRYLQKNSQELTHSRTTKNS